MSVTRQAKESANFNQNEILTLKKKMRYNDSEYNKERAILRQKIELLQNQVNDLVEREENQK